VGYPRPLGCDSLGWRMDEVAQDLPADGGVGVEKPIEYGHVAECTAFSDLL
jgi:hypothetical protein